MQSSAPAPRQCDGVFVAVVSRERFVPAALCWHAQMRRVGTVCPLKLIWDDRGRVSLLSTESLSQLERAFGRESLIAASSLISGAGFGRSREPKGRRLLDQGREARAAGALKYWAWALPFARVVYMDLDTLVLRNVDELVRWPLPANAQLAAVRCSTRSYHFNSGVLVIRPSREFLRTLVLRDCYWEARHFGNVSHWRGLQACRRYAASGAPVRGSELNIVKACESRAADQSVINMAVHIDYEGRKGRSPGSAAFLPDRFNANWQTSAARAADVAVVHFAGRVKPWDSAKHAETEWKQALRLKWQQVCGFVNGSSHPEV